MWLFYHCYKCGLNCYQSDTIIDRISYIKFHLITCDLLRPSGINYSIPSTRSTPGLAWKINIPDTRVVLRTLSSYKEHDTIYIEASSTMSYSFDDAIDYIHGCLSIAGLMPEDLDKFKA